MADIFISYARPTAKIAQAIASGLDSLGYSVWFDQEIPAHRAYSDVISEQLESAKAVIVLWSTEAAASQWVRSEANRAREKGTLIQARLDNARLPMPFDQIQCVDFRGWRGSRRGIAWKRLMDSVGAIVAQEGHVKPLTGAGDVSLARKLARRPVLVGAAVAAAAGAAAVFGWREFDEARPSPQVELLIYKARTVLQDGRPEEYGQATAYLLEATRLQPQFPGAWGALAFSYALSKYHAAIAGRPGEEARCRSAARTALELDENEPFANCALALLVPPYRNWSRLESLNRDLFRRFASIPLPRAMLADLFADLGRWREAAELYARAGRDAHRIPLRDRSIIQAMWSAEDLQRAEAILAEATERWPKHEAIWNLRVNFLTHSGRAEEAIRHLDDAAARPFGYSEAMLHASLLTARAIAGSGDRSAAIQANLTMLHDSPPDYLQFLNRKVSMAQLSAQRCVALGDSDSALAVLDGYYFGRGRWADVAPAAGDEDRSTAILFEPPMKGLWRDPRFVRLLQEIGLEDYWRRSGNAPDFRKG